MDADIHTLYESDFYRIIDFKCRCVDCKTSKPEYSDSFCISFVRKGNFLFNVFRRSLDSYNGCVLISKPGCERTVTHCHTVPDECTIFDFKLDFYDELRLQYKELSLFTNNDIHSTLVKTDAELEFLHFHILRSVFDKTDKLKIDSMVMELIKKVLPSSESASEVSMIDARLKRTHLYTIETAKEYITENFTRDISLMELARHCCVSPFHFSRIFKTFTAYSPHQFLLQIRLKQAELLLKNSNEPVADIAYSSGFNSIEHFTTAFRSKYKFAPAKFRLQQTA